MSIMRTATARALATSLAGVRCEDLPDRVVERTRELSLDWSASALAGKNAQPLRIFERYTESMRPVAGPSEVLVSRRRTSPLFVALGERCAVLETSFKFHAFCRHTHPGADALLGGMREHELTEDRIASVHASAIDVEIETTSGECITSRVEVPKGDPGNTLTRMELGEKVLNLAAFQGRPSDEKMASLMDRVWTLNREPDVRDLLPEA